MVNKKTKAGLQSIRLNAPTIYVHFQALTYTPGPTFTGDMLEFIRTTMFNSTLGARPTAARAVLFLTDGITQYSYAKNEAEILAGAGISLSIIEIDVHGNSTSKDQLNRLNGLPGCDSVLVVRNFADLAKNSEEIKHSLCNGKDIFFSSYLVLSFLGLQIPSLSYFGFQSAPTLPQRPARNLD